MTEHQGAPSDNTTLREILAAYAAAGFEGQFEVIDEASIRCDSCDTAGAPSTYTVSSRRRLEGASDPDDMLAVYAVACPRCGTGGTLVLGYGPAAADTESAVGQQLGAKGADGDDTPAAAPGEKDG